MTDSWMTLNQKSILKRKHETNCMMNKNIISCIYIHFFQYGNIKDIFQSNKQTKLAPISWNYLTYRGQIINLLLTFNII